VSCFFISFLSDVDTEYGQLQYHTEVRGLSKGKCEIFHSKAGDSAVYGNERYKDVSQL